MEKITVNNQIVSMRKLVKQAKLYAINKLVKQRKMLQLKKGTEAQLAKNKRKEERLCEEIKIIKKITVDEVSRNSLMRLKDWKAVLSSKTSTLEERSFALLASFEPLQAEVENFIAKNPRIVNLLPDFYEEWDAKRSDPNHQEAKRMKILEVKLKRKQWKARLKGQVVKQLQERGKTGDGSHFPHQNMQNVKNNSNDHLSEEENAPSDMDDDDDVDVKEAESDDTEMQSPSSKHSNVDSREDDSRKVVPDGSKNISCPRKRRNEAAIVQLDKLQNQESLKISDISNSDSESDADDVLKENMKKRDPFFVSADAPFDDDAHDNVANLSNIPFSDAQRGQRQRRTAETNIKQNFSGFNQRKPFPRRQEPNTKGGFREQRFGHKFGRNQKRDSPHAMNKNFSHNSRDNQHNKPRFPKNNKIDWKSAIARKFPVGHDSKISSSFSKKASFKNDQSSAKRASFKNDQTSAKKDAGLHPSWEAKRKLKQQSSQLLPFQGKKTTFE